MFLKCHNGLKKSTSDNNVFPIRNFKVLLSAIKKLRVGFKKFFSPGPSMQLYGKCETRLLVLWYASANSYTILFLVGRTGQNENILSIYLSYPTQPTFCLLIWCLPFWWYKCIKERLLFEDVLIFLQNYIRYLHYQRRYLIYYWRYLI